MKTIEETKDRYICKIVNSLVSNFASVLFDFAFRERLDIKTYSKLFTSELTISQIDRPKVE